MVRAARRMQALRSVCLLGGDKAVMSSFARKPTRRGKIEKKAIVAVVAIVAIVAIVAAAVGLQQAGQ